MLTSVGSNLERVLKSGRHVVTAELGPPKHSSPHNIIRHTKKLKGYIDAANVTDCQSAVVHMSSISAAFHIMNNGIEPVVQVTCRDRNRIAIQSDLLGAYSMGLKNVLCLSGDHQMFGNHPSAKNVYDIDSIQLIQLTKRMCDEKLFFSGAAIKEFEPKFFIGAVANPFADPFEYQVDRLEKKINAGAEFIQTQCIYDVERFARFMEMCVERGLHERAHILAGVTPLKSSRAAKFMQNRVPGISVPEEIVRRLMKAEDQKAEGISICIEQIKFMKENVKGLAGFHIMAISWEEIIPEIMKGAGIYQCS
ncbi:MAG: methylenetetrahydrofolate reductase [Peptococcaceae bacterium]|nr:methylenetetrahydrofolate reductase [Peptococcaceae bacterium]